MFSDPRTTITGIVGVIAYLANSLMGIVVPQESIVVTVLFFLSLFAKDAGSVSSDEPVE